MNSDRLLQAPLPGYLRRVGAEQQPALHSMPEQKAPAGVLAEYIAVLRESVDFILAALRRYWLWVTLVIALSVLGGFAFWYTRPSYYESELVCQYVNQPFGKKVFGEMLNKLDQLAHSRSANELSRQLGIPVAQAAQILSIEGRNRSGSFLYEDITEEYQPLYLRVRTRDRAVFAPLQAGLLNYLGTTAYEQRMSQVQERRVLIQLQEIRNDLGRIDSMIGAYTVALRNGRAFEDSTGQCFNARNMLEYRSGLAERMVNLERQRGLDSGAVLKAMHGFMPADHPQRESKKIIAAFAIGGCLLALVIALMRKKTDGAHV